MNPDNDYTHSRYNPDGRSLERPGANQYGPFPPLGNNMISYNYLYSTLPHMVYPSYPYTTYPYANNQYVPGNGLHWRDNIFPPGLATHPNYPHNFGPQQNLRVGLRESRDRTER